MADDFSCQLCQALFKDAETRLLHQVSSCPMIETGDGMPNDDLLMTALPVEPVNSPTNEAETPPAPTDEEEAPPAPFINTQEVAQSLQQDDDGAGGEEEEEEEEEEQQQQQQQQKQQQQQQQQHQQHPVDLTLIQSDVVDPEKVNDSSPNAEQVPAVSAKDILAALCVDAPTVEIRNILRLYSPDISYKKQTAVFNAHSKAEIVKTLVALGEEQTNWDNYLKPACVKALIYRIQNLLPEECSICKDVYVVKKSDPHFLSCSVCNQEVHHKCYMPLFSNGLIPNIRGFHFLCLSCEEDLIPEEDTGLRKRIRQAQGDQPDAPKTETPREKLINANQPNSANLNSKPTVSNNTTRSNLSHIKNLYICILMSRRMQPSRKIRH